MVMGTFNFNKVKKAEAQADLRSISIEIGIAAASIVTGSGGAGELLGPRPRARPQARRALVVTFAEGPPDPPALATVIAEDGPVARYGRDLMAAKVRLGMVAAAWGREGAFPPMEAPCALAP